MITLTDLLDCLTPPTLAALVADVHTSGRRDVAAALLAHLSATAPKTSPTPSPIEPQLALTLLAAPVPPMLEEALGYDGTARLVAFYWDPNGDECSWNDGRLSVCGANWWAWLAYTQHPLICLHLLPYDLGSSEAPASHWLVLDREARQLYVGPWDVAAAVVSRQPRASAPEAGPLPTVAELIAALGAEHQPDVREIALAMAQADKLQEELITWLDLQLKENRR